MTEPAATRVELERAVVKSVALKKGTVTVTLEGSSNDLAAVISDLKTLTAAATKAKVTIEATQVQEGIDWTPPKGP